MVQREAVNIASHLTAMASAQPSRVAVVVSRGRKAPPSRRYLETTFGELDGLTDSFAHQLTAAGIVRGMRTVLMAPPSRDFFAVTFALFKLGAVPVFVDPGMGVKNLGACLAEAEPSAFIGIPKAHLARKLLGWAKPTLRIHLSVGWFPFVRRLDTSKPPPSPFACAATGRDEPAAILFTSGSTGVPKGAVYTHGVFDAQVRLLKAMYDIRPGEVDLATFPLFGLFAPALGMTSVLPKMDFAKPAAASPEEIIGVADERRCTTMFGSPALLDRVGRYAEDEKLAGSLPTLNRVITAGAPVSALILDRFSKLLRPEVEIVTPYGATEALPVANIGSKEILGETKRDTDSGAGVCVGKPAPEIEIRIIKVSDEPIGEWSETLRAAPGAVGEIVVKGPVVTREYFNRPDLTAKAKIRDADGAVLHRMGDVGYLDRRGRLWFCGRKSQRTTTPAAVLFTDQVEPIFNRHPKVRRTALVEARKQGATITTALCVELEPEHRYADRTTLEKELLALGAEFPHTAGVRLFLFHPGFPVDVRHNAKIFREKLADWAASRIRT